MGSAVVGAFAVQAVAQTNEIRVPVPQSPLRIPRSEDPPKSERRLELGVSNWAPVNWKEPAYLTDASEFRAFGTPQMNANLWATGWNALGISFMPVWGMSYTQLQRVGTLSLTGQSKAVSQNANLFALRAGVNAISQRPVWARLSPFVGLALMPSYAVASKTALAEGISRTIWSGEAAAGAALEIPWVARQLEVNNFSLSLGAQYISAFADQGIAGIGASLSGSVSL